MSLDDTLLNRRQEHKEINRGGHRLVERKSSVLLDIPRAPLTDMSVDGQMLDSGGVAIMHKVVIDNRELWPTRLQSILTAQPAMHARTL